MEESELLSKLCYYDTRNPIGVISNLSEEEIKEEGYGPKAKENCYCDDCFYGRTKLVEYILLLKSKM